MSKMDALRAMREARFEQDRARAGKQATPPRAVPKQTSAKASAKAAPPAEVPAADDEGLCGHRNISGRTCTRERGHAAKSHRYS